MTKRSFLSARGAVYRGMMREIARRLKRMAFGWSEKGAAKMTRIIIKRFTSAVEREEYWEERIRITGNVKLAPEGIYAK